MTRTGNEFGLSERDMSTTREIFLRYPAAKSVNIFGGRAKGNHRGGSDVDLAIMNDGVDEATRRNIKADFEDSSLPYLVDIVDLPSLRHPELKEHIFRVGKPLYP